MGVMKRLHKERQQLREMVEGIPPMNPWQSKMKAFLLDEVDACFRLDGSIDGEPTATFLERTRWLLGRLLSLENETEEIMARKI